VADKPLDPKETDISSIFNFGIEAQSVSGSVSESVSATKQGICFFRRAGKIPMPG
jgi:hypothetical protein